MSSKRSERGEVRAVGRGGDAVVETSNGLVLVPGALPGELVELAPTASKRGAARGRLSRVLRASAERREAPCVDAHRCGGCPLMIAGPELQRDIKKSFLRDACRELPGAEGIEIDWVTSPAELGYRRRARLAWHRDTIGYRQLHTKRVTDIGECIVLVQPLREAWNEIRDCLAPLLRGIPAKLNLIPMNPHEGSPHAPPSEQAIDRFLREVAGDGLRVTLRRSRGSDIRAACGQLALHPARECAA